METIEETKVDKKYKKLVEKETKKLAKAAKDLPPVALELQHEIDWNKVKTVSDVVYILSELGIRVDIRICSEGIKKYLIKPQTLTNTKSNGKK